MQRSAVDRRVRPWLDHTCQLLTARFTLFPHHEVSLRLHETFEICAASWNWAEGPTRYGSETDESFHVPQDLVDLFSDGQLLRRNGLVQWSQATGTPRAQTLARVPRAFNPKADDEFIRSTLGPLGASRQLAMPYLLDPPRHRYRSVVMGRAGDDFSDEDVAVAQALLPALRAIQHQADILSGIAAAVPGPVDVAAELDLTGRELAVLRLLTDGLTAQAIAHRLGSSPRTVHKHLQHVYRKLEVSDRLQAVLVARRLRLCVDATSTQATGPDPSAHSFRQLGRARWAKASTAPVLL